MTPRLKHVHLHTPLSSKYSTPLEKHDRFESFKVSLNEVDELNASVKARNGVEVYGITKFIDFLPWELRSGTVNRSHDLEFQDFPTGEMRSGELKSGTADRGSITIYYDFLTGRMAAGTYSHGGMVDRLLSLMKHMASDPTGPEDSKTSSIFSTGVPVYDPASAARPPYGETRHQLYYVPRDT